MHLLAVHGVTSDAPVDEMRRLLRRLRRIQPSSSSFVKPSYPFSFAEDSKAIEAKFRDIEQMIETLSSNRQSSEYAKISAALAFIYERINNANATSDEHRSTHLVKSLELSSRLSAKIKNLKRRSSTLQAGALDLSMIDVPGSDSDSDNSDRSGTNAAEGSPTPTAASYTPKPVPVASWGIKFSGTSGDMSVDAFLERVAELKVSRNSSDRLVFDSAVDLFSGPALSWYRAFRSKFAD